MNGVVGELEEGVREGGGRNEVTDESKMFALGLTLPFIKKLWSDGGSLSNGEGAWETKEWRGKFKLSLAWVEFRCK
jgi:hypothetical protein